MASRTNARTLSSRVGVIGANGIVSANTNNFALRRARYLSGSSDIVLMISMIVFSISCVDMLLAMYLAVAVSSSSSIGFPCAIWFTTADYRAWRERFRAPGIGGNQLRFQRVAFVLDFRCRVALGVCSGPKLD